MNNDFSDFFHNATPEEKKRVMLEVMKEASAEQRKMIEGNPYAKNEPLPPKTMDSMMAGALARASTPKKQKGIHSELHEVIAKMRKDFDETAKKGVGSFSFYLGVLKNVPLSNIYRWLGDIEGRPTLNTPTKKAKMFWWHYKVWKDPSLDTRR